ncbi:hypothetical protein RFI_06878, partial [Reticulomyxa filosa]
MEPQLKDHLTELEFIHNRVQMFEKLYARQQENYAKMAKPIRVTLDDGQCMEGVAFKTTPLDIVLKKSKELSKKAIVAKVDNELFDLTRPLEHDCKLEILTFDSDDGKQVFWHSSSHVLGECLERLFKGQLTVGPPLDPSQSLHNGGFYYDVDTSALGIDGNVSDHHYAAIEELIKTITKEKHPFYRVVLTKEEALEMFK